MQNIQTKLIEAARAYEAGKMMRDDSEVEIDAFEDADDPGIYISDYSEERGSAEPVQKICNIGEISNKSLMAICNQNGWAYCL